MYSSTGEDQLVEIYKRKFYIGYQKNPTNNCFLKRYNFYRDLKRTLFEIMRLVASCTKLLLINSWMKKERFHLKST